MNAQEQELLSKIESLTGLIKVGFENVNNRLDNIESRLNKIDKDILDLDKRTIVIETKVTLSDKHLDKLETRFNTFEGKLPDVSEKFGELKNWRQIALLILATAITWFVRGKNF